MEISLHKFVDGLKANCDEVSVYKNSFKWLVSSVLTFFLHLSLIKINK